MRLEQLQYLLGIKKYGSMNMAAQQLHVSQQAISHALKALEEEYNLPLLQKVPHKTLLTKEGEIVAQTAEEIFAKIEAMEKCLERSQQVPPEKYIILADATLKHYVLPKLAMQLYSHYPACILKVWEDTLCAMAQSIADFEADLGVINNWEHNLQAVVRPGLRLELFQRYSLYAFIDNRSPLAKYHTLSLSTIARYPVLLFGQTNNASCTIDDIFKQYLPEADLNYLYNVPRELFNEMIARQQAIVLIPSTGRQIDFLENCVGIKVKENITFCSGYLTRQNFRLSGEFVDLLRKTLRLS